MTEPTVDVRELQAKVSKLERIIEQMTGVSGAGGDDGVAGNQRVVELDSGHTDSRRGFFKLAGAAALGAAGAAVVGAGAVPAGATDGNPVAAGDETTAEAATMVTYDGTANFRGVVLLGNDSSYTGGSADYPAALGGWAGAGTTAGKGGVANGIYGYTDNGDGYGVVGYNSGYVAGSGAGVLGIAATANAVGVYGSNDEGRGIVAQGAIAPLRLVPGGSSLPATNAVGDLVELTDGSLWLCVTAGTPGTFRLLGGPSSSGQLHVLAAPVRVYDSRAKGTDAAATGDGPLAANAERVVSLESGFVGSTATPAVPAGALAALFTLTAVDTGGRGNLSAFSNAVPWPGTSSLNWFEAESVVANAVTSAVDAQAKINVHCQGTSTDFLIDVSGYYQ